MFSLFELMMLSLVTGFVRIMECRLGQSNLNFTKINKLGYVSPQRQQRDKLAMESRIRAARGDGGLDLAFPAGGFATATTLVTAASSEMATNVGFHLANLDDGLRCRFSEGAPLPPPPAASCATAGAGSSDAVVGVGGRRARRLTTKAKSFMRGVVRVVSLAVFSASASPLKWS
jgi:hypothetical protein